MPQRLTTPSFSASRWEKEGREKNPPASDACRGFCGACSDGEAGSSKTRSVYLEYRRIDGDHMVRLPRSSVAQLDAIKTWQPLIGRCSESHRESVPGVERVHPGHNHQLTQ